MNKGILKELGVVWVVAGELRTPALLVILLYVTNRVKVRAIMYLLIAMAIILLFSKQKGVATK